MIKKDNKMQFSLYNDLTVMLSGTSVELDCVSI